MYLSASAARGIEYRTSKKSTPRLYGNYFPAIWAEPRTTKFSLGQIMGAIDGAYFIFSKR